MRTRWFLAGTVVGTVVGGAGMFVLALLSLTMDTEDEEEPGDPGV